MYTSSGSSNGGNISSTMSSSNQDMAEARLHTSSQVRTFHGAPVSFVSHVESNMIPSLRYWSNS